MSSLRLETVGIGFVRNGDMLTIRGGVAVASDCHLFGGVRVLGVGVVQVALLLSLNSVASQIFVAVATVAEIWFVNI